MPNIIHQLKMMTQQGDESRIRDLLQSLIDKNKAPESPYETQRPMSPDQVVSQHQGPRTPYEGSPSMHHDDMSNLYRERSAQRPGGLMKEIGYNQRLFPELHAHKSMQSVHQPSSPDTPPYYFDMRHADATGYFTPLQEAERTGARAADKERLIDLHSKDKPSWSEKVVDFLVEDPTKFINSIFQNHRIHMTGNTGSMEPAVRGGDIVVYKNRDNEELEIGDFVAFRPSWRDDTNIAHRIVDVTEDGWIMRGDNVDRNDPAPVKDEDVYAMFKFRIPLNKIPIVHNASAAQTERRQREQQINNFDYGRPLNPKRHDPAYWLRKYSAQE